MASNTTFEELISRSKKGKDNGADETAPLPVKGGRQTLPDSPASLTAQLMEMGSSMPNFQFKFLEALSYLSIWHEDVSYAVDNIIQLGNTAGAFPSGVYFDDAISDAQAKEIITDLKERVKTWYGGGLNSLTNDLLAQIAVTGAISVEAVPKDDLTGIKKVVLVEPKNIRFKYDKQKDVYVPHQLVNTTTLETIGRGGMIELNTNTYFYSAIRRLGENPYAIPPFLSALESVGVGKSMKNNFGHIMKKLGMLGFLEVLVNGPKPNQGESDAAYFQRTGAYLDAVIPEIDKGMEKGFVTGFKNMQEFKLHSTASSVQGSKDLVEINDTKTMAGLKQDPLMFGRNFSTTETVGRVILAKMTTQTGNYQHLIASFYAFAFLLDQQLAGSTVKAIEVEFDTPSVGDKQREEETRSKQIENLNNLYNQGIIGQQQRAIELGYEKPDQEEPRQAFMQPGEEGAAADGKKTDPNEESDATDEKSTGNNTKLLEWQVAQMSMSSELFTVVDVELKDGRAINNALVVGNYINGVVASNVRRLTPVEAYSVTDLIDIHKAGYGPSVTFPYHTEGCDCGEHGTMNFAKAGSNSMQHYIQLYLSATKTQYSKSVRKIVAVLAANMLDMPEGSTAQNVADMVIYNLYKDWAATFTNQQERIVSKFVRDIYSFFRKDITEAFGDVDAETKKKLPKGVFNTTDVRVMEYYKKSDTMYLGKFITDDDLRKKVTEFLKDKYLTRDLPIGNNKAAMAAFKAEFTELMELEDWKIARIINTSVARMRNTAAVSYMDQAEVEEYEIVGIKDRLQCAYCAAVQGKSFSVKTSMDKIGQMASSDPTLVAVDSPFLSSVIDSPEDLKTMDGAAIQNLGVYAPPFHANCRDTIVAKL